MKKLIQLFILVCSQLVLATNVHAFIINKIDIQGLQGVSPATVESYLPIKRGQNWDPSQSPVVLRSLYQTGFFEHITINTQGQTLIIQVMERPIIGQLKISGNSVIPSDKLTEVMKSLNIAEGRVYNRALIEKIKQSLINQYYQLGRYNARVEVTVTSMARNRVLVKINISEGLVAKVKRITIIGNHAFDEKTLLKQLTVDTGGLFSFFTQTDRYSEEKLAASLDNLRNFYLDHGYIRFDVKSSQAQLSTDRKAIYITIVVQEGAQYRIKDYKLTGHYIVSSDMLQNKITFKPGDVFSRQKVLDSEKNMTKVLGDQGYLFTNISLRPQVNEANKDLILIFDINAGKRTYVNRISFSDHNRTNDEVLRREMQQLESAPASISKLEESKHRLQLLPFIREVDMSVSPVEDKTDQVNVNYKVKEEGAAQATFKIGYSPIYKTILGVGFNHKNFIGTGNTLGVNLQRSKYEEVFGIDYTNPYYTPEGISRSFNFSASRVHPEAISNLNNGYSTNEYNFGVLYGIPIGTDESVINRIQAGINYQNILVNVFRSKASNQVLSYINNHNRHFQALDFKLGYSRDSRDKIIFPTNGSFQAAFVDVYAPVTKGSPAFYTLNYRGNWYIPLTEQFILSNRAELGYGNGFSGPDNFPFFKNFYAGGMGSVRGYEAYTLGPRDSMGKAFGGNVLTVASVGLIFPNFISDNLRTTVFADAGNVYATWNNKKFGGLSSSSSGPIRYTYGIEADWLTPFGPAIGISLAKTLNHKSGDDRKFFDFTLGLNF